MNSKEQLEKLLKIKELKTDKIPKPISTFAINVKLPREKKVEIGERILKEKILKNLV